MRLYDGNELPASVGLAIDAYGSKDIKHIRLYGEIDTTHGFIISDDGFYYRVKDPGAVNFANLQKIIVQKAHLKPDQLTLDDSEKHVFRGDSSFIQRISGVISEITGLEIEMSLNAYDAVNYYGRIILEDIKDDAYEDTEPTDEQDKEIEAYLDDLAESDRQSEEEYRLSMSLLGDKIMQLCDDLELDSDEIDELEKAVQDITATENTIFEQARDMYGRDPDMIKNMTGIDPEELKDKSPEELEQILDDLCARFNISKDQMMTLARKMQK